jgi:hypothetical protein
MAKIAGRLQTWLVGGGDTAVNGIVDSDVALDTEEIDTTTHDDGAFRTFIPGRMSGVVNATLAWDDADAGQESLKAAAFAQTSLATKFRLETGAGFDSFEGTLSVITSMNPSGPNDDKAEMSISARFSGTISRATQS